jgi:hypothetical protein
MNELLATIDAEDFHLAAALDVLFITTTLDHDARIDNFATKRAEPHRGIAAAVIQIRTVIRSRYHLFLSTASNRLFIMRPAGHNR